MWRKKVLPPEVISDRADWWLLGGGRDFMCLPHGSRDMCMISLGLSTLNEYGSGVIDILTGSVRYIVWCIVRRQAIWREGVLVLNLHVMGPSILPKFLPTISEVG